MQIVCLQCLLNEFDKTLSDDEHYSSYASGNQELIANEQFQVYLYINFIKCAFSKCK